MFLRFLKNQSCLNVIQFFVAIYEHKNAFKGLFDFKKLNFLFLLFNYQQNGNLELDKSISSEQESHVIDQNLMNKLRFW